MYYISNWYQKITGKIQGGFETVMDKTLVATIEQEFPGMQINENAFDG
jgi:hypothetical protein